MISNRALWSDDLLSLSPTMQTKQVSVEKYIEQAIDRFLTDPPDSAYQPA